MITVLYIDNDPVLLESGKRFLESNEDIRVETARSFQEAQHLKNTFPVDAVIADYPVPETDDIQVLKKIREKFPKHHTSLIVIGSGGIDTFNRAMHQGADFYISKNGDPKSRFAELSHVLRCAVRQQENERKIMHLNRVYSVLSRVSEAIVHNPDRMQLMQEICRIAVQEGGYAMTWIGFEDPETHRMSGVVASGAVDDFFVNARMSSEDISNGQGPTVTALRKGKYSIWNDSRNGSRQSWEESAIKRGYLSAAAFPVTVGKATKGAITFYSPERDFFTDSEIRLLNGISGDLSSALERMELDDTSREVKEQCENSEHRLREIINFLPEPTFAINARGAVIVWNTALEKLTGISPGQVIGYGNYEHSFRMAGERIPGLLDLVFASDQELEKYHYAVLQRSRKSIRATLQLPDLNGKPATLEAIASPLYDQKGQYSGAIESLHAVTEIRKKEEKFQSLSDTADHGILILEPETQKVIDVNSFVINLTGYSRESLIGRTIGELGFFRDTTSAEQISQDLKKTGHVPGNEIPLETKDGRIIDVEFASERYSLNDEPVIRCSVYDISARKQIDNARVLARKNLTMFSSMMRHDVLNQLMVISGSLELASYGLQEPELIQHLNRAQTAAKNIQRQITFSREYENLGAAAPKWQRVSEVIHRAFFDLQADAITIDVPGDSIDIFADLLLEKVFFHLFNYANKYGERVTRIEVSYQYNMTGLIMTIADNGMGIPPENKGRLFIPDSGNEKAPGLYLTRKILEVTGLTITENGEYKKGTRFEITIPVGRFRTGSSGV